MKVTILTISTIILLSIFCSNASAINPESAKYVNRGDSCLRMNDTYNSLLWYQKAYEVEPSDTVMRRMAQCYFKRGQYNNCLSLIDTLTRDTAVYQDLELKFNCLRKMEAKDSIVAKCSKQIVAINPLDVPATTQLVTFFNNNKNVDSALYYGLRYYNIDSTNQLVNKQLGRTYYLLNDYYRAIELFLESEKNGDESVSLYYYIGKSYEACKIIDRAYDYLLMACEKSMFGNVGLVKSLAKVCIATEHRDETLDYVDTGILLCQADSASMAELYGISADFYCAYSHKYYADSVKREICLRNQIKMLEKGLAYNITFETQYSMAVAYGELKDREMEKKWLQVIVDSKWKKTKANKNHLEYVAYRLKQITEDEFFEGGQSEDEKVVVIE